MYGPEKLWKRLQSGAVCPLSRPLGRPPGPVTTAACREAGWEGGVAGAGMLATGARDDGGVPRRGERPLRLAPAAV